MNEKYDAEEVDYKFGGMNSVDDQFRVIVARSVANLPKEIVDWVTEKLFFVSSSDEYIAFSMPFNEYKHMKGLIFLSEELRAESQESQTFTIAHEVAHLKLKHVSPVFSNLTDEQCLNQEQEADDLALKWLGSGYVNEWKHCMELRLKVKEQIADSTKEKFSNS
jgi:hypothetical protein